MKQIGETWRGLSEEAKAPYLKLAQIDKERYLNERETANNSQKSSIKSKKSKASSQGAPQISE